MGPFIDAIRRCSRAALPIALTALAILPATQARAADVGVNVDGLTAQQAVDQTTAVGGTWMRTFVRWDEIETNGPGRWNAASVQAFDDLVAAAQSHGLKVVATVIGSPQWANGSADHFVPPTDPQDLARFMAPFSARYKGRVAAWEVWNEPDGVDFWHGSAPNATAYTALLAAAYTAVKGADPGAQVYAGPLSGNDYDFLQGIYNAGGGGSFDAVAVHTDNACGITPPDSYYRQNGRVGRFSFLGFREVHTTMEANGDGAKPIVMSELGWSATGTRCARGEFAGKKAAGVTEAEQAANLRLAYHCLADYPYVSAGLWFSMRDAGAGDTELNRYGLLRSDLSRRPAFAALADVGHYGDRITAPCGDFSAPSIRVLSPGANGLYDRSLLISTSANDKQSRLGRITYFANGVKIRSFTTDLKNDRAVDIDWQGARALPFGPVTIRVDALDEFGNTSSREIRVTRVDVRTLGPKATRIKLRLSGRGMRRTVRGMVQAPGTAFPVTGKVRVLWQYARKGHWVTLHKASRNANRSFSYTQRMRRPGSWRVVATYAADRPFRASRSRRLAFRAR